MKHKEKTMMKNFKCSDTEWERYGKLRISRWDNGNFSRVVRMGLDILVRLSQAPSDEPGLLVINPVALYDAQHALETLQQATEKTKAIDPLSTILPGPEETKPPRPRPARSKPKPGLPSKTSAGGSPKVRPKKKATPGKKG